MIKVDINRDGTVDYPEFKKFVRELINGDSNNDNLLFVIYEKDGCCLLYKLDWNKRNYLKFHRGDLLKPGKGCNSASF